ncbi:oxidoreductase [Canicola haemoglobinophilus]|uniref:Phage P2 GpU family protein n=1 Tax=Canicola haemoglobinophilus TaxID=733 RepID=A0A1V4AZX9_9PAST|nr:phage tail protein [Canicola haemoglobinophilus]OOR99096.1 oxidoreductase [Canicola haemoglobinophilus]STO55662.1 phage P2 GpU family protein [Canicola haemoglobinophilus]STO58838.1 phage P2 GpU family protein [Canicola haemoglobinophilus]STO67988.1 phage P2 GpU family protein [Canicola haemoglobinophilus]
MFQSAAMMAYGFFIFMRSTVPYQDTQRTVTWRQPTNAVIGALPKTQFTGKESETMTINGVLMPEITGANLSIAALETLAEQGEPLPLIDGSNFLILGWFVIEEISVSKSYFFADGAARRIDFSMKLKRTDESLLKDIGDNLKSFI